MFAVPAAFTLTCPRCKFSRRFNNVDSGVTYRCSGCEWFFTLTPIAPTGTDTATVTAGVTVAITVASGGASFTSGMLLIFDTGTNAEVVTVGPGSTGTNVPIPGGFLKTHSANATFGQLSLVPTYNGVGVGDAIPVAPGYGF